MRYPWSPKGQALPFPQENFQRWITCVLSQAARQIARQTRRRLRHVSLLVDLMHLTVIVVGIAVGAWALIALRERLPRGRFAVFGAASAGALFGCAALAGEIGLLPPAGWFAMVMAAMLAVIALGVRARRPADRHT